MQVVELAQESTRETKRIEFKESFDPNSNASWCEIIKDIVAMANSGGGILLFGVDNEGKPNGFNNRPILDVDAAVVADKIHSYTEVHFADFDILPIIKNGATIAAIRIGGSEIPLVFTKPGTYAITPTKQHTAFGQGTIYFRHGAKSETGVSNDLQQFVERRLKQIKRQWLDGVAKMVQAPLGSSISIVPKGDQTVVDQPISIRLVEDKLAPGGTLIDPNTSHPYRQVDVVRKLHEKDPALASVNPFDIRVVRTVFHIDRQKRFVYKPTFGSPLYSEAFIDWLIGENSKDPDFFLKARTQFKSLARRLKN